MSMHRNKGTQQFLDIIKAFEYRYMHMCEEKAVLLINTKKDTHTYTFVCIHEHGDR